MNSIKLLVLSALLAGCATMANTPAQDRTYAAIERCKGLQPSGYQVTRVNSDGSYKYYGGDFAGGRDGWLACIKAGGPR
jgi:hypothetical protein